ncbi:MAG: hypothetical protein FWF76_02805 [Oscillospiraceae bacterium]|nr:hypothetical protein [Oscillospiraceae bacterium]
MSKTQKEKVLNRISEIEKKITELGEEKAKLIKKLDDVEKSQLMKVVKAKGLTVETAINLIEKSTVTENEPFVAQSKMRTEELR